MLKIYIRQNPLKKLGELELKKPRMIQNFNFEAFVDFLTYGLKNIPFFDVSFETKHQKKSR